MYVCVCVCVVWWRTYCLIHVNIYSEYTHGSYVFRKEWWVTVTHVHVLTYWLSVCVLCMLCYDGVAWRGTNRLSIVTMFAGYDISTSQRPSESASSWCGCVLIWHSILHYLRHTEINWRIPLCFISTVQWIQGWHICLRVEMVCAYCYGEWDEHVVDYVLCVFLNGMQCVVW